MFNKGGDSVKYRTQLLWIVAPFFIGLGGLYFISAPYLSQTIIVLFWFWVGTRFAALSKSKLRSFVFGNSVWGICFVLFVWQFLLGSQPDRFKALEVISLSYISPFYIVTQALPPIGYFSRFTLTPAITALTVVAYLLMFCIFSLGFLWGRFKQ
jgi:hypothetical protein